MECSSCSAGQGALGMQASMAAGVMNSVQTPPPPQPSVDNAARSAGLNAQGIGQNLDVVA